MFLVNMVENSTAMTGASGKLRYERKQQVMTGLLSEVLEIEVEIGHDGGSGFAFSRYVLDD